MPYIKVNTQKMGNYYSTLYGAREKTASVRSALYVTGAALDWDVKKFSDINNNLNKVLNDLDKAIIRLKKNCDFIQIARKKYGDIEPYNKNSGFRIISSKILPNIPLISIDERGLFPYWGTGDTVSTVIDGVKTTGAIMSAVKAGFFKSGFNIVQVGDYIRIYGKRAPRAAFNAPAGNRVKVGSDVYYGKSYALWYKNASLADRFKSAFSGSFAKDTYGLINSSGKFNFGAALAYLGIAIDTGTNIYKNIKNGASVSKIAADGVTDVAKGLGAMGVAAVGAKVGAALGSFIPIPGVGTLVGAFVGGAVAGLAYNFIVDGGIKIGGKSIAGWVSTGLEKTFDAVGDAFKSGAKLAKNVAKKVGKTVKDAVKKVSSGVKTVAKKVSDSVKDAAKNVGNAVKSAAQGVKNAVNNVKNNTKKFFKKLFG